MKTIANRSAGVCWNTYYIIKIIRNKNNYKRQKNNAPTGAHQITDDCKTPTVIINWATIERPTTKVKGSGAEAEQKKESPTEVRKRLAHNIKRI